MTRSNYRARNINTDSWKDRHDPGRLSARVKPSQAVGTMDAEVSRLVDHGTLVDLYGFTNQQLLDGLLDVFIDGHLPLMKPGHFGHYNPELDFDRLSYSARRNQQLILICESFVQYVHLVSTQDFLGQQPGRIYMIDEMAKEAHEFKRTKKTTLLLMVYSQIFTDINFTLGKDAGRGYTELKARSERILTSLTEYEAAKPVHPPHWPAILHGRAKVLAEEAKLWANINPIDKIQKDAFKLTPGASLFPTVKATIFDRNPLLCGIIAFQMQLLYSKLGLALANATENILFAVHMATACKLSRPTLKWPDMDYLISYHGTRDVFGGRAPKDLAESIIASLLKQGATAVEIEQAVLTLKGPFYNPTGIMPGLNRQGPALEDYRGLTDRSSLWSILEDKHLLDRQVPTVFDIQRLTKLLDDIMVERPQTKLRVERGHQRPKFAICQALAVLEEGMKSEAESIRFDYFSMDTRCLKLLRKLRSAVRDQLFQRLGPDVLDDETQLPILVGDILNMAAATNTMISGDSEGVKVGSKILQDATQVFVQSDLIKKEGDVEVKKVRL